MISLMSRLGRALVPILILAAVVALVVSGILPRLRARQELKRQTEYFAAPTVFVVHPKVSAASEEVVLPGNIQAFTDAPIYARTNGYLKKWYRDLGAHVRQGDLLAEIESPEIDQQLQQAQEEVDTARADLKLAQITATRYTGLFKTDSVAKQDVDNAVQNEAAKAATVKSVEANVRRLQQMVAFEKIYAPFDGVLTARNTDIGQLIDSGSAGGSVRELFHIAAINKLRVFVNVPQLYSRETVPGMKADLTLPEMPGRRFTGNLVRTANALDPNTRTLLVEVDVPNLSGLLMPGSYTEVHFRMKSAARALLVPSTALIFRSEGLRAATVAANDKAAFIPVTLGRDFGNEVEVVAGLSSDSAVIVNPPDSLVDGETVRVVARKTADSVEE
jgi:RND family efflux transporter MFP subunit